LILASGVMPFIADVQVSDRMAELDRLSAEDAERLGELASAPAGAGGEAATRAPAVR
jgi:hypothetical protein